MQKNSREQKKTSHPSSAYLRIRLFSKKITALGEASKSVKSLQSSYEVVTKSLQRSVPIITGLVVSMFRL